MQIINKNNYKLMYNLEFLGAGEIKEVDDKIAKELLKHPNVEIYVDPKKAKEIEEENKKLKEELAKTKKETKETKKGK